MIITFVGPVQSRFVKNDIDILQRKHELRIVDANVGRGGSAVVNLIILQWRIIRALIGSDCLFFWFADYYSLVPTLIARTLGKKVYVFAGGFDVTYTPEVKSGARTRPVRWFMCRGTHRFADRVFSPSKYGMYLLDTNSPHHAPAEVIYNAVDTKRFPYSPGPREALAITVTQLETVLDYILKGIDVFLNVARAMPDVRFSLIGIRGAALEHARTEAAGITNLEIIPGPVSPELLIDYYHRASAYCQLSIDETFGVAVAESMSSGCLAVVSDVPSLREVTGETGWIIDRNDIYSISSAINECLVATDEQRKNAAEYVQRFDIEKRAEHLLRVIV